MGLRARYRAARDRNLGDGVTVREWMKDEWTGAHAEEKQQARLRHPSSGTKPWAPEDARDLTGGEE